MKPSLAADEPLARLLLAAESELAQKGFHAASLNDILKAAEVSKGSFYHHFEDKEALFVAECLEEGNRILASFNTVDRVINLAT